jgi:hypothetical protein
VNLKERRSLADSSGLRPVMPTSRRVPTAVEALDLLFSLPFGLDSSRMVNRSSKQRIWAKEHRKVMIVHTDDGVVDGIFETDGYVAAQRLDVRDLAGMIAGRVQELRTSQN